MVVGKLIFDKNTNFSQKITFQRLKNTTSFNFLNSVIYRAIFRKGNKEYNSGKSGKVTHEFYIPVFTGTVKKLSFISVFSYPNHQRI